MDVSEIRERLATEAEDLARHLLPGGRRNGSEWVCKGKNSPSGSPISICINGHKKGLVGFWNGSAKRGGSIIDLIMEVEGRDIAGAIMRAKWYLGIDDTPPQTDGDWRCVEKQRREARARAEKQEAEAEMSALWRLEEAQRIWGQSCAIAGTLAESYLLARGLRKMAWPESLRFHPAIRHAATGQTLPALICQVINARGFFTGIWRIYINRIGSDKADVEAPKMGLGTGGAVVLSKGNGWISVAEGVETGMGALQMAPNGPAVYALMSTSGMAGWEWPADMGRLTIYPDGDRPKERNGRILMPPGMEAAKALERRTMEAGIPTTIMAEPLFSDYLDVLNKTKGIFATVDE